MDDDLIDTHIYKVVEIAKLKTRGKIHTLLMWWSGLRKPGLTGKLVRSVTLVGRLGPNFKFKIFKIFTDYLKNNRGQINICCERII